MIYIPTSSGPGCSGCSADPCGACGHISILRNGDGAPLDSALLTPQTVMGYDCCCINPKELFPYEGSSGGDCGVRYTHTKSPVIITSSNPDVSKFVIAGNPRFDSTIEIDGVEITSGTFPRGNCGLSTGPDCPFLEILVDTEYAFSSPLSLQVFDYCKIVAGVGEVFGVGSDGLFCFCEVPAP